MRREPSGGAARQRQDDPFQHAPQTHRPPGEGLGQALDLFHERPP
jgi:hypothetical protein